LSASPKYVTRDPRDFYATPEWCVQGLYKSLPSNFPKPTLDPCAGTGALCLATNCRGIEKDESLAQIAKKRGATVICGDGLRPHWLGQHIVLNPPYGDAMTWVERGVSTAESCCALVRLGFLASKKRKAFWDKYPPQYMVILSHRPSFTENGKKDSADYAWMVWVKGGSKTTEISWIDK